ncbi:MAG: hypothetical protein VXX85_03580, partial [Candidatus Margulisiibacteriota bacterium]|nr:hypothetical protein [Candidatus Margulisiibacteriota bacterium]
MNTTTKSFNDIFTEANLTLPSQKDEDWIYYNLDELNQFELLDNETKEATIETNPYFIYFINNELVKYNLPDKAELTKDS